MENPTDISNSLYELFEQTFSPKSVSRCSSITNSQSRSPFSSPRSHFSSQKLTQDDDDYDTCKTSETCGTGKTCLQFSLADISEQSDCALGQEKYGICGMFCTFKVALHNIIQILINLTQISKTASINREDEYYIGELTKNKSKCNQQFSEMITTSFILHHIKDCSSENLIRSGVDPDCVKYFQLGLSLFFYLWNINEKLNGKERQLSNFKATMDNDFTDSTAMTFFRLLFEQHARLNFILNEKTHVKMFKNFLEIPDNKEVKDLMEKVLDLLNKSKPLLIYSIFFDDASKKFKIIFNGTDCGEIDKEDIHRLLLISSDQNLYSNISTNLKVFQSFTSKFDIKDSDKHCIIIQQMEKDGRDMFERNSWGDIHTSPDDNFDLVTDGFLEKAKANIPHYDLYEINGCLNYNADMFEQISTNIKKGVLKILKKFQAEAEMQAEEEEAEEETGKMQAEEMQSEEEAQARAAEADRVDAEGKMQEEKEVISKKRKGKKKEDDMSAKKAEKRRKGGSKRKKNIKQTKKKNKMNIKKTIKRKKRTNRKFSRRRN